MANIKRKYAVITLIFFTAFTATARRANDEIWTYLGSQNSHIPEVGDAGKLIKRYSAFHFNQTSFRDLLKKFEGAPSSLANDRIFIPTPDGTYAEFIFEATEVLHPALGVTNPDIKTFKGVQVSDPSVHLRYDITPTGLHAQVISREGLYYVTPISDNLSLSFFADQYSLSINFSCQVLNATIWSSKLLAESLRPLISYGMNLKTYRLAVATTGEYTTAVGGTKPLALASIATAINFVNGIYESEIGIQFQIIPSNLNIIYTNPNADPYTPTSGNPLLLSQNQINTNGIIGAGNYDVGHLFHALPGTSYSGSGIATLGSVCRSTSKAHGVSTASPIQITPINPLFYRVIAHELGHQLGANHSFNASCNNTRNALTAYEPGSGSSIMSLAGGCSPFNIKLMADPYFHRISLEEISAFLAGPGSLCGSSLNTLNNIPTAQAGPSFTIPKNTPFVLTGSGSDADATNVLTYDWEQYNNEITTIVPPSPGAFVGPNFRSFPPTLSPTRFFPRLTDVLNNKFPEWEVLPSVTRTLNFSLVVRDNVGGASSSNTQVTISAGAGPFVVLSPNGGETIRTSTLVTWSRANTNLPPVNVAFVTILLSLDNGKTYPIVLASNTPNDGSESVSLPTIINNTARVQIKAEGNIFFDVSDAPFVIRP